MRSLKHFPEIILCVSPIDFRKGIRGLSVLIESGFGLDVFSVTLFIFTNKSKDAVKMLYWDKTGFAMWHKILDRERFKWPKKSEHKTIQLSSQELYWLLEGIDLSKIKKHNTLTYSSVS